MTKDDIEKVLCSHEKWLHSDGGEKANLRDANLRCANNIPCIPMTPPEKGSFIAFKKCQATNGDNVGDHVIVELLINADAERCSATTRKCRASKATVTAITDMGGNHLPDGAEAISISSTVKTTYKVGETVVPDKWDDYRWNECSHGIHFFLSRKEAESW